MLDSSLRRLARTIDAYPRRIAIACLIAAVLAAAAVARIPVTTDLLDVMPDRAPAIVAFTDFLRDFGILGGLVIVVETQSDAPDALIAVVQALGEQLSASPPWRRWTTTCFGRAFGSWRSTFRSISTTGEIARLAERLTPRGDSCPDRGSNREVAPVAAGLPL